VRHDEHVFAGGAAPAAVSSRNPYKGDKKAAEQGGHIFTAMNCDGCHGAAGAGWVGPSLADGRWRFGGTDGDIFESIYYGRPHGMPAYGGLLLSPGAVWKLVTYLQALEPPADVPTERWK
jgi:cytochrome c oxidase cbb3-type subunit 3